MAHTINFTREGYDYTLEYTRKSAQAIQERGFDDKELETKSLVMIPLLVKGAFMAHHRNMSEDKIWEIYKSIGNKVDFVTELLKMYYETVATLTDEPEDSGKVEWTVSG